MSQNPSLWLDVAFCGVVVSRFAHRRRASPLKTDLVGATLYHKNRVVGKFGFQLN
jgi:hypothetical protein